jgi:hypothetical protein
MYEKIISIEECSFSRNCPGWRGEEWFEGYIVTTENQTFKVGISSGQSCCENYGYLTTNDDLSEYIGAHLVQVATVDTALDVQSIEEQGLTSVDACMFVNFSTSKGTMQLVAYNEHNGYYGHTAVVISESFNYELNL